MEPLINSMMPTFESKMSMIAMRRAEGKGGAPSHGSHSCERGILAEPKGTLSFRAICCVRTPRKDHWTLLRRPSLHLIPVSRVVGISDLIRGS